MFTTSDEFVRTRSIPTAAALVLLGHKPTRFEPLQNGSIQIVFPGTARNDLNRFIQAKDMIDAWVERESKR